MTTGKITSNLAVAKESRFNGSGQMLHSYTDIVHYCVEIFNVHTP